MILPCRLAGRSAISCIRTAQRVSDYNNIKKEDFDVLTKNVMREENDPEHPGEKLTDKYDYFK